MQGMNRVTGKPLAATDHIYQSVTDILMTPLNSRVMLLDYGSLLPRLIDNPTDGNTTIKVIMATAGALAKWEPRIRVDKVQVLEIGNGKINLFLAATDIESGAQIIFDSMRLP